MKREIEFRGKRIDNGELVYGDLEYSRIADAAFIHTYGPTKAYAGQFRVDHSILRAKHKNGRQDLDKAIHYCELAIDLDTTHVHHVIDGSINKFVKNNNLAEEFRVVLLMVDDKMYKNIIEYLSDTEYIEKIFL